LRCAPGAACRSMHYEKRFGCVAAGFAACLYAATSLGGCASLGRPSVTPQAATVAGIGPSGLTLGVDLLVDNPNPFSITAEKVTGTLSFGAGSGKRVGTAEVELEHPIAAKSSEAIPSSLEVAWTSLSALREFIGASQVPYTFDGELKVGGGPLDVSVPFRLQGQLEREQLAKLGAAGLKSLLP
jgi:hypothetical protein